MENIYNLPRELQIQILEFYYQKQSLDLCADIKSFVTTRDLLIKNYKAYWYDCDDENYLDWLANDITAYMNDFQSTIDGYTQNHIDKWKRLFYFKNKSNNDIYNITSLAELKMPAIQDISTRIGIMTPKERKSCLHEMIENKER
jgi:hypothetical protein